MPSIGFNLEIQFGFCFSLCKAVSEFKLENDLQNH